jgi:hypothetical protein
MIRPFPYHERRGPVAGAASCSVIISRSVAKRNGIWGLIVLALCLTTCGDDKPFECTKPAECVGRPNGNDCKKISGKGQCVFACAPVSGGGSDVCPAPSHCTGTADDGTTYCLY